MSSTGLILVVLSFIGCYIGVYLDTLLNMSPNMTILFLLLGTGVGFWNMIRESKAL
jgi:F0F1-type ATP synthase assembly protein I